MQGIVYNKYGAANEVVELSSSIPLPSESDLGSGDILVRQMATSINPVDYKMILGNLRIVETFRRFPIVPCFDVCGVIEAVGSGCSGEFSVGDRVIGYQHFTRRACAAELVIVQEKFCARMPSTVTPAEAAGIPLVGVTSYQALVHIGKLQQGEHVLVLGGSGGTGLFGVQIAKARGAQVTTTCGARNADLLRSLGADRVLDYRTQNWWEELKDSPPDVIYDCVGGTETWPLARALLAGKHGSRFVTIAGDRQDFLGAIRLVDTACRVSWRKIASWWSAPTYTLFTAFPGDEALKEVARMVEEGKIKPIVDSVYNIRDLQAVRDAFAKQMSQRAVGKIVLTFNSEAAATPHSDGTIITDDNE